jgi:hypothetical protein
MPDDKFGHCQHCKYFGSPARAPLVNEEAACHQPNFKPYKLVVFGASGCTLFELRAGLNERIEEPEYAAT